MSYNIAGLEYEQKVYDVINSINSDKLKVIGDKPSGGFNAHDTDMKLDIGGTVIDLEIKADSKAQMGGTSFSYCMENSLFESVKEIPNEDLQLIKSEIKEMEDDIKYLIERVKKSSPVSYNSKNTGFPLATTKETWTKIQQDGYLLPLNKKIRRDTSFIHEHYVKKSVNYIQIGGSGLFYLKDNPLNLPIPQLNGEINIEVRAGRSGSKLKEYRGEYYNFCGVGLRIQGRLKFNGKSGFTLDCNKSVNDLISEIF